jgi:hypothetical protein
MVDDRQRLSSILDELGYKPELQGDHGVRIMFDGVYATVLFYGDGTLSLICSVKGEGIELNLDDVNAANNRVRFAKFSVDARRNLQLEADFVFPLGGPESVDQMRHLLKLWRQALHELKALVETLVPA